MSASEAAKPPKAARERQRGHQRSKAAKAARERLRPPKAAKGRQRPPKGDLRSTPVLEAATERQRARHRAPESARERQRARHRAPESATERHRGRQAAKGRQGARHGTAHNNSSFGVHSAFERRRMESARDQFVDIRSTQPTIASKERAAPVKLFDSASFKSSVSRGVRFISPTWRGAHHRPHNLPKAAPPPRARPTPHFSTRAVVHLRC